MARVLPKFSSRRLPTRRTAVKSGVTGRIEPAVGIRLLNLQPGVEPGGLLEFEYCVKRVDSSSIDRLEISIAWRTEGKGSEDFGVHFFQSASHDELPLDLLSKGLRIQSKMPSSPLSYEGRLFKIRWGIRLRLYLVDGREISTEQPFYLGHLTSEL